MRIVAAVLPGLALQALHDLQGCWACATATISGRVLLRRSASATAMTNRTPLRLRRASVRMRSISSASKVCLAAGPVEPPGPAVRTRARGYAPILSVPSHQPRPKEPSFAHLCHRGDAAQRHRSYFSMPVLAIADPAKSIVAICMQLVKYILHLLNCTVWPARGARRLGHSMSGGVMHAGSRGGLRPTIISRRRERRGFGAEDPPWLRSPGRSPERNRGHPCENDNGQRNVRRHPVLHAASSATD